jgi:hypothetical protein
LAAKNGVVGVVDEPGGFGAAEPLEGCPLGGEGGIVGAAIKKVRGGFVKEFAVGPGSVEIRSGAIQPQSARNSRLMSQGLPAKAEEAA